jgi:nucleotide-binding universal stress UspA family protein
MKILLAIDDSKFSEACLQTVITQFQPRDAELRLMHVVVPLAVAAPPQMAQGYAPELEPQIKAARELVERAALKLRAAGFKVDSQVEEGDVRERIIDSAAEWRADLIVVGSHGRTGLARFLLGSTAESVAHHAPCSVEIVRGEPEAKLMKVLLAIDDSKFSEAAIRAVIEHIRPEPAEVCVLHVVEPLLLIPEFGQADLENLKTAEDRLRRERKALVDRAQQLLLKAGIEAFTVVREGDPRTGIIDQAAEWKANLVVLGSHGRKGMNRLLMGSVAEYVARHAFCSVWIARIAQT